MNEFLIVLIVLAVFVGGYYVMGGIDRFLARSLNNEPLEYQQRPPCSMMLTDSLSDEELIHSIRHFAAQHKQTVIILRESLPDDGGNVG